MTDKSSFFAELKRRNVLRAATLYAAGAWLLVQVITQVGPVFDLPPSTQRWVIVALVIGFPFALVLSWFYELTPEGFKRESEVEQSESLTYSTGRKLDFWIIGVLTLAVVLLLTNQFVLRKNPETVAVPAVAPGKSIAVLPFENLSDDKGNAYFANGMQDMILTKLAGIGELKVISRTSTEKYASHPDNLKTVAQQLGVATILEGSVQKSGNQVLINVQLIDASTDGHLWAEAYPRTLDNIFGVEGEVAQKVADALKAKLTPAETTRIADKPTQNPVAYDLFLRAGYLGDKGDVYHDTASIKTAISLYQQAIAADPRFALAWARLSFEQGELAWYGGGDLAAAPLYASARANAERALALQPDSADAQLAMGYSDFRGLNDYPAALDAFAAALRARPNDPAAMAAIAYVLRRQGRFDTAVGQLRAAQERDPRQTDYAAELAVTLMYLRRYPEAEQEFEHALALDPDNVYAKLRYSDSIVLANGDVNRAMAQVQGNDPQMTAQRAHLLTLQRNYRAAIDLLDSIQDTPENFDDGAGPKAMRLGTLYRLAGDTAQARTQFEHALPQVQAELTAKSGSPWALGYVWENIAKVQMGLGQSEAALAAMVKSQALVAQSADRLIEPYFTVNNAQLYAQAGRADLAVALLEQALATPSGGADFAPPLLWIDPAWDPIRQDPRFQALLKKYASWRPANSIPAPPPASASASAHAAATKP